MRTRCETFVIYCVALFVQIDSVIILKQVSFSLLKRASFSTFRCGHEEQVRCCDARDGNISECHQILVKPNPYCWHDVEVIELNPPYPTFFCPQANILQPISFTLIRPRWPSGLSCYVSFSRRDRHIGPRLESLSGLPY